jgi:uncharacterized protein
MDVRHSMHHSTRIGRQLEFEWDPAKARANLVKHGVAFEAVRNFDWNLHVRTVDDRFNYSETRYKALGKIEGRVHALIFAANDNVFRLISLRKANSREVRFYEQNI